MARIIPASEPLLSAPWAVGAPLMPPVGRMGAADEDFAIEPLKAPATLLLAPLSAAGVVVAVFAEGSVEELADEGPEATFAGAVLGADSDAEEDVKRGEAGELVMDEVREVAVVVMSELVAFRKRNGTSVMETEVDVEEVVAPSVVEGGAEVDVVDSLEVVVDDAVDVSERVKVRVTRFLPDDVLTVEEVSEDVEVLRNEDVMVDDALPEEVDEVNDTDVLDDAEVLSVSIDEEEDVVGVAMEDVDVEVSDDVSDVLVREESVVVKESVLLAESVEVVVTPLPPTLIPLPELRQLVSDPSCTVKVACPSRCASVTVTVTSVPAGISASQAIDVPLTLSKFSDELPPAMLTA